MIAVPGDFQLVPVGGAAGVGIRVGQWLNGDGFENFEHVRLFVRQDEPDFGWFVQAEPNGAQLAKCPMHWGVWSTGLLGVGPNVGEQIAENAYRYIGTPYGFLDYAALAACRLHLPVPGLRGFIASDHTMICSQLVAQAYLSAGINLFPGEWPGYVTPGDLYQLLVSKGLKP